MNNLFVPCTFEQFMIPYVYICLFTLRSYFLVSALLSCFSLSVVNLEEYLLKEIICPLILPG